MLFLVFCLPNWIFVQNDNFWISVIFWKFQRYRQQFFLIECISVQGSYYLFHSSSSSLSKAFFGFLKRAQNFPSFWNFRKFVFCLSLNQWRRAALCHSPSLSLSRSLLPALLSSVAFAVDGIHGRSLEFKGWRFSVMCCLNVRGPGV